MGILSQLVPGEKKVLAVNGHLEGLKVIGSGYLWTGDRGTYSEYESANCASCIS